jgi:hypothetical protein
LPTAQHEVSLQYTDEFLGCTEDPCHFTHGRGINAEQKAAAAPVKVGARQPAPHKILQMMGSTEVKRAQGMSYRFLKRAPRRVR